MKWRSLLCWVLPVLHVNSASPPWRQRHIPTAFSPNILPTNAGFCPQCRHPSKPAKNQGGAAAAKRDIGARKAVAVSHPETRGLTDFRDMQAELFKQFSGLFDNADQVREERAQGMGAGPEGGHEQIHCKLEVLDVPKASLGDALHIVGATYYFDDNPEAVFRCRLYSFHDPQPSTGKGAISPPPPSTYDVAEMRLLRFRPEFEAQLRAQKYDLQGLLGGGRQAVGEVVEGLEGCEIVWSHRAEDKAFLGRMRHGGCTVQSQRAEGVSLWIEDDLKLQGEVLCVNDRGIDCETRQLVYGNHRGLPYTMTRREVKKAEKEKEGAWEEDGHFCSGEECSLDWMWDDDEA